MRKAMTTRFPNRCDPPRTPGHESNPDARAIYSAAMRTDPLAYLGKELDLLKEQRLYRHLRILEDEQKAHTTVDHRSVVNLSSNNYLGLTTHPKLRQAALRAIEEYGVGTGSVRTIAGTMDIHMELEKKLAE